MIEPAWFHLKRMVSAKKGLSNRAAAIKAWTEAWENLEQWRINRWIEKIVERVQKVIELKGGNEYPN